MVRLSKGTVEQWLANCEEFSHCFMEYTFTWHHAVGADLDLLAEHIKEAHAEWTSVVAEWRTQRFRQETEGLSYTKIFAILLYALSKQRYVGEMREYEPFRQPRPEFNGTEEERRCYLDDLLGAPEAVSAFQFCVSVLNFYESNRLDRKTPFEFRLTESGRHDLLVLLTGADATATAVYMALEGLYSRD